MKQLYLPLLVLCMACTTPKEKATTATDNTLGTLEHAFPVSELSKANFEQGLLLLHSFEYQDARTYFKQAIEDDPEEMMAYWGEAMSHYRALWGLQDVPAGRAVMAKVGETKAERLARMNEGIERDFWEGLEYLYGEGELAERNQAFADHMAALYEKYPKNQEVAAFYSLGLMWSVPLGRDEAVFEKSAQVAAGILDENPNHPGALHYMIHAYDDPEYAIKALQAANKYAKVAPDAAHALHMPSHIYLAQGMWNEVVASNEASYTASVKRMERLGLDDGARGYHSYAWLYYGRLQQGNFREATRLLEDMLTFAEKVQNTRNKSYLIGMQCRHLVETGSWNLSRPPMVVDYGNLGLGSKARSHFFKGLLAYSKGEQANIQDEVDTLLIHVEAAELIVTEGGIAMCSAGPTRYAPNRTSIMRAEVMANQLLAMKAILEEQNEQAEEYLQKATALETETEYSYGPPDIPYPSFEQYADWLMEQERYQEALVQYEKSLQRAPNRTKALKGKVSALKQMGRKDEVKAVEEILAVFYISPEMASL
jgi:tetratricopeptide (TPR) repeat protein